MNICKPLFSLTPFDYFDYERYYHDGTYFTPLKLCSDEEFAIAVLNQKLLPTLEELQNNKSHYAFLSTSLPIPEAASQQMKFLNNIHLASSHEIYHRCFLIFNYPEYVEIFGFGFRNLKNKIFDVFMNNFNFLEKFCSYFRIAAQDVFKDVHEYKIIFDVCDDPKLFKSLNFKNSINYQEFLNELQLKKYPIEAKNNRINLTKREFECLFWCVNGKTAKETARILSLSPRTVEDYIKNIKQKLGCESKIELIDIALRNPLIKSLSE